MNTRRNRSWRLAAARARSTTRKIAIQARRLDEPAGLYSATIGVPGNQQKQLEKLIDQQQIAEDDPGYLLARMLKSGMVIPIELAKRAREKAEALQYPETLAYSIAISRKIAGNE